MDLSDLRAWNPTPFRQYVIKIHSRCNLACDYCYIYSMQDQSWRSRPAVMSTATLKQTAFRIAESVRTHRLADISVVLHGGEPLLAGSDFIAFTAEMVRSALPPEASARLSMQTHGVLVTRELLDVLQAHDIRVGASLDGDQVCNDSH